MYQWLSSLIQNADFVYRKSAGKGGASVRKSLYDYCAEQQRPELLAQRETEANLPLTPEEISYGSKTAVHWVCGSGHRWTAMVYTRTTSGAGCPVCAGRGKQRQPVLYPAVPYGRQGDNG